ncbi:MAG: glycosyltransferase family 2 protein [Nitriliruptoraceae bacterium]
MADLSLIVVTHNTRDETRGCLESLPDEACEVIVVDSGSSDGTVAMLRDEFPQARSIELDNVGFGRSVNVAMRLVSSDYVAVCNADVRWRSASLHQLADALVSDKTIGLIGPQVLFPSGRRQASARALPTVPTAIGHALLRRIAPRNRWTRRYHATAASDTARDVDWLSGCAFVVRRVAFEQVGGFDPGFFLYVEDVDLARRLRAAGWRVYYLPGARVTHRAGASTAAHAVRARFVHARSLARYARKYHRSALARVTRPMLWLGLAGWVAVDIIVHRLRPGQSTTAEVSN